ncbi:hypothetical protein [Microbacterium azadirachtae]|uniref:Big-1 domain-containing protein n=1 Tax=Microbacterium azadirachtae TaxID=582680 RepID=A0A0F0LR29_9MICO|nr:hypothetical protein [Microbacterium azadirachtae]KJL35159.1 hypothetical protein RS86_00542 [Microbacterium azadirachtae]
MIARRVLGGVLALLLLAGTTACTASASRGGSSGAPSARAGAAPSTGAETSGAGAATAPAPIGIRLLGPDEPVPFDGEAVSVVVEVTGSGGPISGADVTFTVVSGPAAFPGRFEVSTTDETGVTAALMLTPTGPGEIVLRVASGDLASTVTVTIAP